MPTPSQPVRILLLADSHLGFDLPSRPRVERRRRGHDFQANYELALAPAKAGKVDLVVHGGDVFHRSRVPASLVFQAFRSLLEIAESGIPVFVVPGNHERSRVPHLRFASHPNLFVFRGPETFAVVTRGVRVALSGFPYQRESIRPRFPRVLEETGWHREVADLRLLCLHHCVEGATVGPSDHTFRHAPDVIRCSDLPREFAAVLSGHIHRHQVLSRDLQGRMLPTPVLYPGSLERTAFAEMKEEKGYLLLEVAPGSRGGELVRSDFVHLPARPMVLRDLRPKGLHREEAQEIAWTRNDLQAQLLGSVAKGPRDAVLRIRVHGSVPHEAREVVAVHYLRQVAPREMNLEVLLAEDRGTRQVDRAGLQGGSDRRRRPVSEPTHPPEQLEMVLPGPLP